MTDLMWLAIPLALATFLTRIAGYLMIARFKTMHYRLEAALDAVPTAVIAALVIPTTMNGTWPEFVAINVAFILSYKLSLAWVLFFGMISLIGMRAILG